MAESVDKYAPVMQAPIIGSFYCFFAFPLHSAFSFFFPLYSLFFNSIYNIQCCQGFGKYMGIRA